MSTRPSSSQIKWDPNTGLAFENGVHSPALLLEHEADHAYRFAKGQLHGSSRDRENRATSIADIAARELGEPIREDYYARAANVYTRGPTSNRIDRNRTIQMYRSISYLLGRDMTKRAQVLFDLTGIKINF